MRVKCLVQGCKQPAWIFSSQAITKMEGRVSLLRSCKHNYWVFVKVMLGCWCNSAYCFYFVFILFFIYFFWGGGGGVVSQYTHSHEKNIIDLTLLKNYEPYLIMNTVTSHANEFDNRCTIYLNPVWRKRVWYLMIIMNGQSHSSLFIIFEWIWLSSILVFRFKADSNIRIISLTS